MISLFRALDENAEHSRIPNRQDPDYFDLYGNPSWEPPLWYHRPINLFRRCLYFMSGPKFVVPITGNGSSSALIIYIKSAE